MKEWKKKMMAEKGVGQAAKEMPAHALDEAAFLSAELSLDTPELDLHGLRLPDAEPSIILFLEQAVATREPALRIIHGKGEGALRDLAERILKEWKRKGLIYGYQNAQTAKLINAAKIILPEKPR
jgi:dsDNA-specific endonuclease/ATPase MutS2